ncbi:polyribonucleotide nucleotidyltransferase [Sarracenia purpurea var. burkii]
MIFAEATSFRNYLLGLTNDQSLDDESLQTILTITSSLEDDVNRVRSVKPFDSRRLAALEKHINRLKGINSDRLKPNSGSAGSSKYVPSLRAGLNSGNQISKRSMVVPTATAPIANEVTNGVEVTYEEKSKKEGYETDGEIGEIFEDDDLAVHVRTFDDEDIQGYAEGIHSFSTLISMYVLHFTSRVDYKGKQFAQGVIPNTYMRKEGAPKEQELLCGRLID